MCMVLMQMHFLNNNNYNNNKKNSADKLRPGLHTTPSLVAHHVCL